MTRNNDNIAEAELDNNRDFIQKLDSHFWYVNDEKLNLSIFVARRLDYNHPKTKQYKFSLAEKREVDGLMKRKIWSVVNIRSGVSQANVIGGRSVMTLKTFQTPDEAAKVKYIA